MLPRVESAEGGWNPWYAMSNRVTAPAGAAERRPVGASQRMPFAPSGARKKTNETDFHGFRVAGGRAAAPLHPWLQPFTPVGAKRMHAHLTRNQATATVARHDAAIVVWYWQFASRTMDGSRISRAQRSRRWGGAAGNPHGEDQFPPTPTHRSEPQS